MYKIGASAFQSHCRRYLAALLWLVEYRASSVIHTRTVETRIILVLYIWKLILPQRTQLARWTLPYFRLLIQNVTFSHELCLIHFAGLSRSVDQGELGHTRKPSAGTRIWRTRAWKCEFWARGGALSSLKATPEHTTLWMLNIDTKSQQQATFFRSSSHKMALDFWRSRLLFRTDCV